MEVVYPIPNGLNSQNKETDFRNARHTPHAAPISAFPAICYSPKEKPPEQPKRAHFEVDLIKKWRSGQTKRDFSSENP
ncbi:MAG: hypothetical protein K9L28_02490 [Synergistales bacterium]|nr:hypothetical protein [Synergistales bacterium]